jgi:hypothetical protein
VIFTVFCFGQPPNAEIRDEELSWQHSHYDNTCAPQCHDSNALCFMTIAPVLSEMRACRWRGLRDTTAPQLNVGGNNSRRQLQLQWLYVPWRACDGLSNAPPHAPKLAVQPELRVANEAHPKYDQNTANEAVLIVCPAVGHERLGVSRRAWACSNRLGALYNSHVIAGAVACNGQVIFTVFLFRSTTKRRNS